MTEGFVLLDKLSLRASGIDFFMYQQDGRKQPMRVADTFHNRQCVAWIQVHDAPPKRDLTCGDELTDDIDRCEITVSA